MNPRTIVIEPVLNGFVVQVGCQRVVFDSPAKLGAAVVEYYSCPAKAEHQYLKNKVNDTMDRPVLARDDRERIGRIRPAEPDPIANQTECCAQEPTAPPSLSERR